MAFARSVTAQLVSLGLLLGVAVPAAAQTVTRGPYLQSGTPTSMIVKWRTTTSTNARVRYGPDPGNLIWWADEATVQTNHEVVVNGLTPNTRYYYSIGTISATLAGGDANHFFVTPPMQGTSKATRVWILGDSGTANADAAAVRNAYVNFTGSRYTDVWLMLGDNAYNDGTDAQYENAVFDMYPAQLRQTVLWPTLGNHDGVTANSAAQTGPYYDIFTLPKQGEAGGLPSGTEAYYSFNFANIHFVCLESYETDRSTNGAMLAWLRNDLAVNTQPWIVAYWHHPPYSKGSHDSDTEIELIEMRENALPILESYGVDLVLSGHSHSYERSFLIDGHYDSSGTFNASMKKDGGSGRTNGTGAYRKPDMIAAPHTGAVYAVAGSSGQTGGGALNHPAMYISLNSLGSMVLDINGDTLDATFLDSAGVTRDDFTIAKGPANTNTPPTVAITSPANGRSFHAPATISIAATASDADGLVSKVEFFRGTTLLGADTTSPYSFTWSNVGAGAYSLTARATDDSGAVTTSSAVPITVIGGSGDGSGDFNGDGKADIVIFRPSNGTWYLHYSGTGAPAGVQWGNGGDLPVAGDYDGDGRTDIAVFRPSNGTWYIVRSSTGAPTGVQWGNASDIPKPGDYDGDGRTDIGVFRPSNGTWYIVSSSTGTPIGVQWGNSSDVAVPGDYNGDGTTDIAVFRPSNGIWFLRYSGSGGTAGIQWGNGSDIPVAGDYDGDGKTDIAVFRPSNGTWYVVSSRTGAPTGVQWGNGNDVPVPGDYDGDGRTDLAVFRPSNGTWYILNSAAGSATGVGWGNSSDIPILKRP